MKYSVEITIGFERAWTFFFFLRKRGHGLKPLTFSNKENILKCTK